MAFTSLKDGGLSVTIDGTERASDANGLEWETTLNGDGGGGFWLEVSDPFAVGSEYPELHQGSEILVQHTLDSTTTELYRAYVLNDPRVAYAGETAYVDVQTGGALEVIKGRTDLAFVFEDGDTGMWYENKKNPKHLQVDTSDCVTIRVEKGDHIPGSKLGTVSYILYLGAEHMLDVMPKVKWITAQLSYKLQDHLKAAILWSDAYTASRSLSAYHVLQSWGPGGSHVKPTTISYAVNGSTGAGHLALAFWSNENGGTTATGERYVTLDDVVVRTDTSPATISSAMLKVAQVAGLMPNGSSVSAVDSLVQDIVVRPYTDPTQALSQLAAQAGVLVEWGYFKGQFIVRPLDTDPTTIRGKANCYKVDSESAEVDWDVHQHPEDGLPRSIRLVYGSRAKGTRYAAGTPRCVVSPSEPGWATNTPFMGGSSPVMTVDCSDWNQKEAHAQSVADKYAELLGTADSSGSANLYGATVPVYGGGSQPVPYIRGGDWIENQRDDNPGPLYITRCHVDADTGYVDLDCGLSDDVLIDQLASAHRLAARTPTTLRPHKPKRRRRKK